jgi:hypothetical protein
MPHQRTAIRNAVKALLLNHTSAAARVFSTRETPWERVELPGISIYTLEETVEPESGNTAPIELRRTLQLAIEIAIKAKENIDDEIDAVCLQVEKAMHADETLNHTASMSVMGGTEISVVSTGQQLIGLARLIFTVTYFTYAPDAADQTLDDFSTADVHYSLANASAPADQAEDLIEDLEE